MKAQLEQEKKKVTKALQQKHSVDVLLIVFNRLYTLRNQLMHGGSTYKSSLNRKQLQDGCQILSALLPAFLYLLWKMPIVSIWVNPFTPWLRSVSVQNEVPKQKDSLLSKLSF